MLAVKFALEVSRRQLLEKGYNLVAQSYFCLYRNEDFAMKSIHPNFRSCLFIDKIQRGMTEKGWSNNFKIERCR